MIDQLVDLDLAALDADLAAVDRRSGMAAVDRCEVTNHLLDLAYLDTLRGHR